MMIHLAILRTTKTPSQIEDMGYLRGAALASHGDRCREGTTKLSRTAR